MSIKNTVEAGTLKAVMALPERVQRVLAGAPVVLDGQTLATETQLMLRLQRVARMPAAEEQPIPRGRVIIDEQSIMAGGALPIGATRDLTVGSTAARLYTPTALVGATDPAPLLLFFHGGGFMYGGLDSHDGPCRLLAERAGCLVLAIDYRLAPEHPFPAAYDDCLAALRWVHEHATEVGADVARIAVGGDSAGGNLSAGVAIAAAREGLPLKFQLLVYPATDNTRATRSLELFASGFFLTERFMELATDSYLPVESERLDPRASPAFADVPDGLAAAYVCTAGFDPLRDEGEAYARRLADAGVTVELKRFPDLIHSFFNVVGVGRTSRAAVEEIADTLKAGLV